MFPVSKKKKQDHELTLDDLDILDEIHNENKEAFKKDRDAFSNLPYGERLTMVHSFYNASKEKTPVGPCIESDDFSKLFEKKRVAHHAHVNIPIPWEKVKTQLNKEGVLRRGNQLINSQVESFISQLPYCQPIFPTFNRHRHEDVFRKRRLFEIMNGTLEQSGIHVAFFTVVKRDNVIVASVDLLDSLVWCSIVFFFEKNILEEVDMKEEVVVFSQEDLDDDTGYGVYLFLNVSFIDYFFHLCPCFDAYVLENKKKEW